MEFIPYSRQSISAEDIEAVCRVLRSEYLTQGPEIAVFEQAFANFQNTGYAVAVGSATAGLHLACIALGVGRGSRVWTVPNSFVASANCALYCGADVDFVDIDPNTRNMSVQLLSQKLVRAEREGCLPHVLIPVHFAGLPCDMKEISALSRKYGFKILEDASHAIGAKYDGKNIGSQYSDISVFSLHAVKIITTGEGGIVATNDARLASHLKKLRSHGITRDVTEFEEVPDGTWSYEQQLLGFNYRMTDMQAALGSSQLLRVADLAAQRLLCVHRYSELLKNAPVILPLELPGRISAWHLFSIELDDSCAVSRRALFDFLRSNNIGVNVHYFPIHLQPHFKRLGFKVGDYPNSERYYQRALTIPLFPGLEEEQQVRIAQLILTGLQAS